MTSEPVLKQYVDGLITEIDDIRMDESLLEQNGYQEWLMYLHALDTHTDNPEPSGDTIFKRGIFRWVSEKDPVYTDALEHFFDRLETTPGNIEEKIDAALKAAHTANQLNHVFEGLIFIIDAMMDEDEYEITEKFLNQLIGTGCALGSLWAVVLDIQSTLRLYTKDHSDEIKQRLNRLDHTQCPRILTLLGIVTFRTADKNVIYLNTEAMFKSHHSDIDDALAYLEKAKDTDPLARAYYHHLHLECYTREYIHVNFESDVIDVRPTLTERQPHLEALEALMRCGYSPAGGFFLNGYFEIFWEKVFSRKIGEPIPTISNEVIMYVQDLLYGYCSQLAMTYYGEFCGLFYNIVGDLAGLRKTIRHMFTPKSLEREYPDTWAIYFRIMTYIHSLDGSGTKGLALIHALPSGEKNVALTTDNLHALLVQTQDQFSPRSKRAYFMYCLMQGKNVVNGLDLDLETLETLILSRQYFNHPTGQAIYANVLSFNLESDIHKIVAVHFKGACSPNRFNIFAAAEYLSLYEENFSLLKRSEAMLRLLKDLAQFAPEQFASTLAQFKTYSRVAINAIREDANIHPQLVEHCGSIEALNHCYRTLGEHLQKIIFFSQKKPKSKKQKIEAYADLTKTIVLSETNGMRQLQLGRIYQGSSDTPFVQDFISRDNDCFFSAMGTTRHAAIAQLEARAKDSAIRQLLAVEIYRETMVNSQGVTDEFDPEYIPTEAEFLAHLALYKNTALWVPYERKHNGVSLPCLAMAFATVFSKNLVIYQPGDEGNLNLAYEYQHDLLGDTVYMLHVDNNHFDKLVPLDKYEQTLIDEPYNYNDLPEQLPESLYTFVGNALLEQLDVKAQFQQLSQNTQQLLLGLLGRIFIHYTIHDKFEGSPVRDFLNTIQVAIHEINQAQINQSRFSETQGCFQRYYNLFYNEASNETLHERIYEKCNTEAKKLAETIFKKMVRLDIDFLFKKHVAAYLNVHYPDEKPLYAANTPLSTLKSRLTEYTAALQAAQQTEPGRVTKRGLN